MWLHSACVFIVPDCFFFFFLQWDQWSCLDFVLLSLSVWGSPTHLILLKQTFLPLGGLKAKRAHTHTHTHTQTQIVSHLSIIRSSRYFDWTALFGSAAHKVSDTLIWRIIIWKLHMFNCSHVLLSSRGLLCVSALPAIANLKKKFPADYCPVKTTQTPALWVNCLPPGHTNCIFWERRENITHCYYSLISLLTAGDTSGKRAPLTLPVLMPSSSTELQRNRSCSRLRKKAWNRLVSIDSDRRFSHRISENKQWVKAGCSFEQRHRCLDGESAARHGCHHSFKAHAW